MNNKIIVGISACLNGENVRHNGGHSRSRYCLDTLGELFSFEPCCPEVAIGMGTPRPAIRLVGDIDSPEAVGSKSPDLNVTIPLREFSETRARQVEHLSGFVFMKNSPSCGLYSAKVYRDSGYPHTERRAGIFADAIQRLNPNLPVEEDGRLNDAVLRENFIQRVFAYHDWQHTVAENPTPRDLVGFHSRYKYMVMAHSQSSYNGLGQLVATAGTGDARAIAQRYIGELMAALKMPAKRKAHTNVLLHILGYLKQTVTGGVREEIARVIEQYRIGHVHLAVPITLLQHYLNSHGSDYIRRQAYLNPYPAQLGLRNYI